MDDFFGEVISSYTRAQAIEDGVLIDLTARHPKEARQLFKYPVACTAALWAIIEAAVSVGIGNDYAGVVWDLLYMSIMGVTCKISDAEYLFEVVITGAGPQEVHTFRAICGPGDEGEPVVTLMMPDED